MTQRLLILGTGGTCLDIVDTVAALNAGSPRYDLIGFLDDNPALAGQTVYGLPVLGRLCDAPGFLDCQLVNGIGSPDNAHLKDRIIDQTRAPIDRFETLVHPVAAISPSAIIGAGTVLLGHVTVGPRVILGGHVMVLPGAVISHDCTISDYSCIAAGATLCGHVTVAPLAYIGAGSTIRGDVQIGQGALVGMGSVVLEDVEDGWVVCGNPAAPLRQRLRTDVAPVAP